MARPKKNNKTTVETTQTTQTFKLSGFDPFDLLREVFLFNNSSHTAHDIHIFGGNIGDVGGGNSTQDPSHQSLIITDEHIRGNNGNGIHRHISNNHTPGNHGDVEILFYDIKKRCMKYFANMGTYSSSIGLLPYMTSIPCWNCRRKFTTPALGIPIRFIRFHPQSLESNLLKKYFEEMNFSVTPITEGYFETEGVVCRWECMKNFVLENISSPRYKDSVNLMYMMHNLIEGTPLDCRRGGSFKTLKTWGGHLADEDYDYATSTTSFVETVNVRRPMMFSISRYYEQLQNN